MFYFIAKQSVASQNLSYEEQKSLYEAQQKLKTNNVKQSISILQEYIDNHKDTHEISATTYLLLGNCWHEQNKLDKARQAYSYGLKIEPENTVLLLNYAISCFGSKKYHQAGQSFEKLYQIHQDPDPEHLYRSGVAFFQAEEYKRSQDVLQQLMAIEGDHVQPEWVELLIYSSVRLKDWDTAKNSLYRILDATPRHKQYWKLLAQIYLQQGSYQQAASVLEITYALHPHKTSELKELASIYLYLNLPLKAAKALEKAYGNRYDQEQLLKLSQLYSRAYRYEKAIACIDKALKLSPCVTVYLKKGRLCYQAGLYKKAITALQKSLDLNHEQGEAFILLGYTAWQIKDWDLARNAFVKAKDFTRYRQQAKDGINSLDFIVQARELSGKDQSVTS
jgi:tetratricopeptide (TPR) repeat protein